MSDPLHQLREALGGRLRELRLNSGLTGTELAHLAGWHQTKVSKIEYGKTKPTDGDISHLVRAYKLRAPGAPSNGEPSPADADAPRTL
ncbi:helix-turn-helix transcriptional regulator [Nocardia sp. NPDC004604]|uniref:helix-turn-helix domain-containing protein n=1 Tax=Nocardia sp. NPDC004604 TaxID=3157013 RepID=UPI0033B9E4A2